MSNLNEISDRDPLAIESAEYKKTVRHAFSVTSGHTGIAECGGCENGAKKNTKDCKSSAQRMSEGDSLPDRIFAHLGTKFAHLSRRSRTSIDEGQIC